MLAVAAINQAIDMNDDNKLIDALENPEAKLQDVEESLGTRYLSHFVAVKNEKRDVSCSKNNYLQRSCYINLAIL